MQGGEVVLFSISISTVTKASELSQLEELMRGWRPCVWDEGKAQVALWLEVIASVFDDDDGIYYVDQKPLAFTPRRLRRHGKPTNGRYDDFLGL